MMKIGIVSLSGLIPMNSKFVVYVRDWSAFVYWQEGSSIYEGELLVGSKSFKNVREVFSNCDLILCTHTTQTSRDLCVYNYQNNILTRYKIPDLVIWNRFEVPSNHIPEFSTPNYVYLRSTQDFRRRVYKWDGTYVKKLRAKQVVEAIEYDTPIVYYEDNVVYYYTNSFVPSSAYQYNSSPMLVRFFPISGHPYELEVSTGGELRFISLERVYSQEWIASYKFLYGPVFDVSHIFGRVHADVWSNEDVTLVFTPLPIHPTLKCTKQKLIDSFGGKCSRNSVEVEPEEPEVVWIQLQLQRLVGTWADGEGKYWFVYEEGGMIKLVTYEDGGWSAPVDLTLGRYPKIWFDGTYVYLSYVKSEKVLRIKLLPSELGYLGLGFNLWDCIGMSGFVNSVGSGKFRGCVGEFGNVDRIVWNYKGEIVLVSYPDSFVGGIPVPTGLYWSDSYNRLNWSDVVVQSPWSRRFRIYEEGVLFAETDQVSYYDEGFSRGMNYWVTTVLRNTITGEEWEGCPSGKIYFDALKIGNKEYFSFGSGIIGEDVQIASYYVDVEYVTELNTVGGSGIIGEDVQIASYYVEYVTGGSDMFSAVVSEQYISEPILVSFFPTELM